MTRLSEIYFPELCSANNDPRAELKFIDGIKWVKDAAPNSVDIIIVDSTDPIGPAEGLFSVDFYRDCFNCLTEHGIVVQQSESALLHMNILKAMREEMAAGGLPHAQTVFFPQCIYPSGWWSATMAAKNPLATFRERDAADKNFDTVFYNRDIHAASLAMPEFFKQALKG